MRRFNVNELLWTCTLVFIDCIIIYGIITGNIYNILSRRLVNFSYVAVICIAILAVVQIPKIFTVADRGGLKKSNSIFILAIGVMAVGISSQAKVYGTNNMISVVIMEEHHNHEEETIPDGTIDMSDEKFYCYLEQMQKSPDKYNGRKVKVSGQLRYQNNQYLITKSIMNCCAADVKVYGIILNGAEEEMLSDGKECTIYGEVKVIPVKFNNKNIKLPAIYVKEVQNK